MRKSKFIFFLLIANLFSCSSCSQQRTINYNLLNNILCSPEENGSLTAMSDTINPLNMGLNDAKTNEERYYVLYNTHKKATDENKAISYQGIDSINIEIPTGAKPIPLGQLTDFAGVRMKVLNNSDDVFLFQIDNTRHDIKIAQNILDCGDFRNIPQLKKGVKLLCLGDNNPWIEHRGQDGLKAPKYDIIILKDGIAQNEVVMPYSDSTTTRPFTYYYDSTPELKVFKNLVFIRDADSQYKTWLVQFNGVYNILVYNLNIVTPEDETKYADKVIQANHCGNVVMRDILINGTYSQRKLFGYGINVNFSANLKFFNIICEYAKWGVFCTNCTNNSYLKDCKINRYDVHCYGKDITMENCELTDLALPISSVYGKIKYKNCTFKESEPITIRDNYYAYVPFDLEITDCKYYASKRSNCIFNAGSMDNNVQLRKELRCKCLPNIRINRLRIVPVDDVKEFYIFKFKTTGETPVDYLKEIRINNLKIDGNLHFEISNNPIKLSNRVKYRVSGSGVYNTKKDFKGILESSFR